MNEGENTGIAAGVIRTMCQPRCQFCQTKGGRLYDGLRDTLFGATGEWSMKRCLNPSCGILWLDPMPIEEDINRAYHGYITHEDRSEGTPTPAQRLFRLVKEGYWALRYGYARETCSVWKRLAGLLLFLDPPRRAHADFTVMYLPFRKAGRLLDIGCGGGALAAELQQKGWTVEGLDLDADAVSNAKSKGLRVHHATVEAMRYNDDHFHAVIMSHVIEHVHEPLRLMKECRRILAPGGHVSLVTPNAVSLAHRMFNRAWRSLEPPRHLHIFTPAALRRLALEAGLQPIAVTTTIREANGTFGMSRSLKETGSYVYGGHQSRLFWAWARGMQWVEWTAMKVAPDLGEELVLVATKS